MSDTIISALIGAGVAIVTSVITVLVTLRVTNASQKSLLLARIQAILGDVLIRATFEDARSNDPDVIRQLQGQHRQCDSAIKELNVKGLMEKSRELDRLMEDYFRRIEAYGAGEVNWYQMDDYRIETRDKAREILSNPRIR